MIPTRHQVLAAIRAWRDAYNPRDPDEVSTYNALDDALDDVTDLYNKPELVPGGDFILGTQPPIPRTEHATLDDLSPHSLVGSWFVGGGEHHWQGRVIAEPQPSVYLVQTYSWHDGTPVDGQRLITLHRMTIEEWTFHDEPHIETLTDRAVRKCE